MRRSKFTEEQQVMTLWQAGAGTPVFEICRKLQITEATFFGMPPCHRRPHVTRPTAAA